MRILDILSPNAVKVPLESTDKQAVIDELIDLLAAEELIHDPDKLKEAVWEREQQRSTGIGEGLAIPHGRCNCTSTLAMAIGRPPEPIDFNAMDKKPVKLVVLLASAPDKTADHIQALGKLSRMMANPAFRENAYAAETSDELYKLFRNAEQ